MIQRIQSVYLALVTVICLIMFFVPLSLFIIKSDPANPLQTAEPSYKLSVVSLTRITQGAEEIVTVSYALSVSNGLIGCLAVISIFLFKTRKRQLLLCRLNLFVICIFIGLIFWIEDQTRSKTGGDITYLIGTYLPVIQLILTYLSERAIKKDDDLVKSADRLR